MYNLQQQIDEFIEQMDPQVELIDVTFCYLRSPTFSAVDCYVDGDRMRIWCSEDNDIRFEEDINDYEPFKDYVLRTLQRKYKVLGSAISFLNGGSPWKYPAKGELPDRDGEYLVTRSCGYVDKLHWRSVSRIWTDGELEYPVRAWRELDEPAPKLEDVEGSDEHN